MKSKFLCTLLLLTCGLMMRGAEASPEVPGADPKKPVALVKGTVHPIVGPPITAGVVLFDKGKIVAVGKDVAIPEGAQVIDVSGKHVYPGLFDAHTNMGLVEINSVKGSVDDTETGSINPNVKAQVAVNPDSEIIPTTRSNGVLLALTAPSGSLIAGRSAVLQMDGWTWEDMTVRGNIAMHLRWPDMPPGGDSSSGPMNELRQAMERAKAYSVARRAPNSQQIIDARWEAMLPVLDGKLPLLVYADEAQQIQAAVAFAELHKLKIILHGGYDAPRLIPLLKKHNIPVIVEGTYRLPLRRSDDYDAAYTVPERLHRGGIKYCIASTGRFGATNVRNLPYQAANAVAYGLPVDEGLKAITLYPAEILGVADRVGSLEVGKDATLFVASGNPLETETQVTQAFVQGRPVEMNDRHKRLFRKYEEKQNRLASP